MKNIFSIAMLISATSVFSVMGATTNTYPADGNVGIGTTTPSGKLQIVSEGPNYPIVLFYKGLQGGVPVPLALFNAPGSTGAEQYNVAQLVAETAGSSATSRLTFDMINPNGSGWSSALTMKAGGNVGIGTTNPTAKLTVIGTISATEIKVTASGYPDYVFSNDYKLRTLEDVEAHIKAHKHLPGVPSADEVEKNGLALSEISKKQMEKIEELTLYLIEMKKQNNEMKKQCEELRERVEVLEKK